jgi:hypothetical protein
MKISLLLLCMLVFPAQAEIYRWVDDNGNVIFSDEPPHPQAETIELPASTTYTPAVEPMLDDAVGEKPDSEPDADEAMVPDYQLRIISPANDESVWVNNGNVTVSMIVEPALDEVRGDKILLQLDGEAVGAPQALTSFQLNNLSRGTYSLSAAVVDNNGEVLSGSEPVVFHLHRASVRNNPNLNQGPNPNPTANPNPNPNPNPPSSQ